MMKRKAHDPHGDDVAAACTKSGDGCVRGAAVINVDVSGHDLSSAANYDGNDGSDEYIFNMIFKQQNCNNGAIANNDRMAAVESLDVSRCRLGPDGTSRLLSFLANNNNNNNPSSPMMRICLRRNAIGSVGGRAVGAFLSSSSLCGVEMMDIGLNDIKAGGGEPTAAKTIADALKQKRSTLKTLVMDKCALGPDGATDLAEALAVNSSLETLELSGNMIGPKGGEALFRALKSNSTLVRLGLKMNRIGGCGDKADVRSLSDALVGDSCRRIVMLDLSYNDLRCSGCTILSKAIMTKSCPLKELTLEKNDIKEDGARDLANALVTNRELRTLVLKGNDIGNVGAIALGKMLVRNESLTVLNLSSCSIGNEGGAALGRGLARNFTLEEIELDKNSLGSGGSDESFFSVGVMTNEGLKTLRISGNGLAATNGHVDGVTHSSWGESIANALSTNSTLLHVDLSSNALSDPSIIDAAASLDSSIEHFDFSDNDLEHVSIETQLLLSKRLMATTTTTIGMELDLSLNPLSSPPLGRLADYANLRDYLALLANEKTAVTRIRLMVLGFGGVGKSTFCRAVTATKDDGQVFQSSLTPVQEWGVGRLVDWAGRLGTSWSKDAVRLIFEENITGQDLTKLAISGGGDDNGNGIFRPSRILLDLCSSKYPSIDSDAFARAISALIAKGYLSTVGAVKVEGTIDLGERTCSLVDFAGQVEFLVSHQLLLSSMHTLCMVIQPAPSFGKPDHRHFGSWDYWSKFLSSLGDRRRGSLLLAVSQLDKLGKDVNANNNSENQAKIHAEREFSSIKGRSSGAISCGNPLELNYCPDSMAKTISSIKRTLSKSLDEVAHSWWVPSSYELIADILQCAAKQKSSNHELPILTKSELMQEVDAFCKRNPDCSSLLTKIKTDAQLLQRAINYLEAVGDVMHACDEWLLIDPIGWFSAFLAHFIKDDLAVSTIQVDSTSLRRQRGTVNLKDIVQALKHEYKSPQQHITQIMSLLCGLELCVPLKTNEQYTSSLENFTSVSFIFPCLLPPLMSQSEMTSCGLMRSDHFSDISAVRGHRFREPSGFIPPGLFVGILARMYHQLEYNIMQPARMWRDHAVLVLNNKKTRVILRCDLDNAIIDIIACASENEQLFVGAAKGQASIVIWLVHLIKMFLRSYSQLNFEESWLCPNPWCHGIGIGDNAPSEYRGSDFLLSPTMRCQKSHDCNVEGCWRFLGTGHKLEPMKLQKGQMNACKGCNNKPVFTLREKVA